MEGEDGAALDYGRAGSKQRVGSKSNMAGSKSSMWSESEHDQSRQASKVYRDEETGEVLDISAQKPLHGYPEDGEDAGPRTQLKNDKKQTLLDLEKKELAALEAHYDKKAALEKSLGIAGKQKQVLEESDDDDDDAEGGGEADKENVSDAQVGGVSGATNRNESNNEDGAGVGGVDGDEA